MPGLRLFGQDQGSIRCVFQAGVLATAMVVAASGAQAQSAQNASPMVEHTRAHQRIEALARTGLTRSIEAGLSSPVTLYLSENARAVDRSLLIHFMGAEHVPIQAVANGRIYDALAVVNLGSGSIAFERPFLREGAFDVLIESLAREGVDGSAPFQRIDVSAFSAGYGAVRAILSQDPDRIHGVLLLDALHTGYVPGGTVLAAGGRLDTTLLAPFKRFAERAAAEEKVFVLTHSEVFPGTFASTTETSDYLLDALGLRREAVLKWGPVGMQQLSEAGAGHFTVLGFAGNSAPDHVDHLHGMPAFLRLLHVE